MSEVTRNVSSGDENSLDFEIVTKQINHVVLWVWTIYKGNTPEIVKQGVCLSARRMRWTICWNTYVWHLKRRFRK